MSTTPPLRTPADLREPGATPDGQGRDLAVVDSGDLYVEQHVEKDVTKEAAVRQKRVWVRVTRLCNLRCTFCLDSWNQNGTYVPTAELKAFIRRGREQGGQRLILSGGEATIHPDYLKLVRYGRTLGYEWIQTVTNGQMFAYPKFARAARVAGLDEVTFSMHGHTPRLHDMLVGMPGAFERAVQGIRNALAVGGLVVNVDIVVNRLNAPHLRDILDFYMDMGIREFDLLYIVPFGRGFEDYRPVLFFDPHQYHDAFQRAFEVSKQPGVYLWTNRFPLAHLEGYEHLIQDPHKLHYEVNGGRHNFDGFLQHGTPPDCYGERCDHCFLAGLCRTTMFRYRDLLERRAFPRVRLDLSRPAASEKARAVFEAQQAREVEVVAPTAQVVRQWAASHPFGADALVRAEVPAAEAAALWREPGTVDELVVRSPDALDAIAASGPAGDPGTSLRVVLTRETAAWLLDSGAALPAGVRAELYLPNHEFLSGSRDSDPDPATLRALAAAGWRIRNVPRCVGGPQAEPGDHDQLDLAMLDANGRLDTDAYVHRYITGEYYARSLRCEGCSEREHCRGMHVNYIRHHGFKVLEPLGAGQSEAG